MPVAATLAALLLAPAAVEYLQTSYQIGRALDFAFGTDVSALHRVELAAVGMTSLVDSHALGNLLFPYVLWYDNGLVRLMSDFGVFALAVIGVPAVSPIGLVAIAILVLAAAAGACTSWTLEPGRSSCLRKRSWARGLWIA